MQRGFSLLELMVSLTILAVLAGSAGVGFSDMYLASQEARAVQVLRMDLKRAQSEAQASGGRAVLSLAGGGTQYTLGIDLLPYNSPSAADTVLITRTLPVNITVTLASTVVFNP